MPKTAEVIRSDTRRDLLFFGLPAVIVFSLGLVVCARDGFYEGIVSDLFDAVRYRDSGLLSAAQIGGVVFFSVGLITMVVAQATLKRSYSGTLVVRSDHQLVTHGIYRFIRHPIYLGGIMGVCIGIPMFAQSPLGFLILLTLIPIVLNRIRMEEELLTAEYGDTYRAYQERTRKLIPFIY